MFNLTGSEIIFILLIALVVLGPEKLPGAIKRAMTTYQELRKMGDGFQSEFRSAIDEPLREMRETVGLIKDQADPKKIAEDAERVAHKAALKDSKRKEVVAEMHAAGERALVADALSEAEAEQAWRTDMEKSHQTPGATGWAAPIDLPSMPGPSTPPSPVPPSPAPSGPLASGPLASGPLASWGSPAGAPTASLTPPPPSGPLHAPAGLPIDPTADDEENAA